MLYDVTCSCIIHTLYMHNPITLPFLCVMNYHPWQWDRYSILCLDIFSRLFTAQNERLFITEFLADESETHDFVENQTINVTTVFQVVRGEKNAYYHTVS